MQAFLWAIAGNTLFAALLAVIVWLASRVWKRRPALIHALWILVLLKLVTPPFFDASDYFTASAAPAKTHLHKTATAASEPISIEENISESIAVMEMQLRRAQEAKLAHDARPWWPTLLIVTWAIGSLGFLSLALYRALRFSWLLRSATLADLKLVEIAQAQADRLGLKRLPMIKVVSAYISPLVWQTPMGTSIILPQKLVGELGPDQLRLLLAHELAHVMRGDPLVRWFALGVLTLHWWNPIVWLAVRQIEAAQEACCDSLVLSASGASPKRYAEMLLTTVDFLAGQETPPPALAAGFTSGSSLKGRCEMILSKRTPFALAPAARWTLALLGLAILPLSTPLFGQEEKKPSGEELTARVEKIEKMLEEMKALLGNRAAEEREVRARLEAANADLQAKMKQRQDEERALRDKIEANRALAEAERARAVEAVARARESADKKDVDAGRLQKEIQDKVQAELAKVQEEVARATKQSTEAAAKLAQDLAKSHGEGAEKLSAELAEKIKDQVSKAEKMAREHADRAEKFATEHAKKFEEHAKHAEKFAEEHAKKFEEHAKHAEKYIEEHAKHAEEFAEKHAKHFQEHAEKYAKEAEKHAKMAIEKDLPQLKEHLQHEAEKLAKVAEEMSKNPEMKQELEAIKDKMGALKEHMNALGSKELGKMKEQLKAEYKEKKAKEDDSASDLAPSKRDKVKEEKSKEDRAKEDAKRDQRRAIEQQLRDREQHIRDLQREVEKLRKELGGADRQSKRNRSAKSEDVAAAPVLGKIPYINRLFRNKNVDEVIDEVEVDVEDMNIEIDLDEEMDLDVEVDLAEEVEEATEVEEAEEVEETAEKIDRLIERKFRGESKDAPPAIEVLKRARLREDKVERKNLDAPAKP